MTIHGWLKEETIKQFADPSSNGFSIGRLRALLKSDGTAHVTISDKTATGQIPKDLAEHVDYFTVHTVLNSSRSSRTTGIYRLRSAKCVVRLDGCGYVLEAAGKVLVDCLAITHRIQAGTIAPKPRDNWESEQVKHRATVERLRGFWEGLKDRFKKQFGDELPSLISPNAQ